MMADFPMHSYCIRWENIFDRNWVEEIPELYLSNYILGGKREWREWSAHCASFELFNSMRNYKNTCYA